MIKKFKDLSLTVKLVAFFLLFGLLPMSIIGVIAFKAGNAIEDKIGARFQVDASNIADKIDRNLFERYGDVQAFGLNRAIFNREQWYKVGEQENGIVQVLNQYVDTYDIYYLTILVDLEGKVIAVNSKDADGRNIDTAARYQKNYRNAPWFRALANRSFTTRMPFTAAGNDVSTGTYIEDLHIDEDVKSESWSIKLKC